MARRTRFAPGTPCWTDLPIADPAAAATYYGQLFGWTVSDSMGAETGDYRLAQVDGAQVAGIWRRPEQMPGPALWATYLATDDIETSLERVTRAGGAVHGDVVDVMGDRMAVVSEPSGASFLLWHELTERSPRLVGEPSSVTWVELTTREAATGAGFLAEVFEMSERVVDRAGASYRCLTPAGGTEEMVGVMAMEGEQWPADLPAHWMVYFGVSDCEATAARVGDLGGSVSVPPTPVEGLGTIAVVGDPQGGTCSIVSTG